jgi:hypothetical protein
MAHSKLASVYLGLTRLHGHASCAAIAQDVAAGLGLGRMAVTCIRAAHTRPRTRPRTRMGHTHAWHAFLAAPRLGVNALRCRLLAASCMTGVRGTCTGCMTACVTCCMGRCMQAISQLGGFRPQGQQAASAARVLEGALALQATYTCHDTHTCPGYQRSYIGGGGVAIRRRRAAASQ